MMHQAQLKRIRRKLKLAAIADKKQKFFAQNFWQCAIFFVL